MNIPQTSIYQKNQILTSFFSDVIYYKKRSDAKYNLTSRLKANGDKFLSGLEYMKKYNYPSLDQTETVPY